MKNITLLFLLVIGQVVSAQSDSIDTINLDENEFEHWSVRRGTDVMFDEVALQIQMTAEVDFDIEVEFEKDIRDKLRGRQRDLGLNGEHEIDIEWHEEARWITSNLQIWCRDVIGFPIARILFLRNLPYLKKVVSFIELE